MATADVEVNVNYSVKELLAKMDTKLDVALAQLVSKADHESVERLERRVTQLESFKSRVYGGFTAVAFLASAGAFTIFHSHHW